MTPQDSSTCNAVWNWPGHGLGSTFPNPLVGCVIVHNGLIIGEGWHRKAGEPHAEVLAIASVKNEALLPESTIYVSLEPCSHYGKTPPCANLIIAKKIKKVVIGTIDPFAKVAGNGIQLLKEAGCQVTLGVLEDKCNQLNKRFFYISHQKATLYYPKMGTNPKMVLSLPWLKKGRTTHNLSGLPIRIQGNLCISGEQKKLPFL